MRPLVTVKFSGLRLGGAGVARYLSRMTTPRDPCYAGYRYLRRAHQLCGLAVFPVPVEPTRVEEMLAARGVLVTYETIRQWGLKFG